ncbi:MAG: alpha/beta hydrolase [Fibrobacter sp.]|nr:alpha/beta hydrolase [Fibrobacter sp.]
MAKKKLLSVVVLTGIFALTSCDDSESTATGPGSETTPEIAGLITSSSDGFAFPGSSSDGTTLPGSSGGLFVPPGSSDGLGGQPGIGGGINFGGTPAAGSSSSIGQAAPGSSSNIGGTVINSSSIGQAAPGSSSNGQANPGSSSNGQVAPASSSSAGQANPASSSEVAQASGGIFLAEGKEEEKDLLKVVYKTRTGWDGEGILAYPEQLSSDKKHAIVVWGPGGGEQPGKYEGMIRRLASHGFVVIALKESPGDASQAMKALDWMEQQNKDSNSPLNGKLDMNTVGCSGHSMGGLESEQAAIKDKRVITAFLNNSGDRNGGAFKNIPATKTAGVVFGEKGMEHDNAITDYRSATSVPACMIEMTGGPDTGEGGYGHGSGPWDGMAVTIAWMRWHLGGEDFRKADFVGSSGKYINGNIAGHQGKWKGECKNFN